MRKSNNAGDVASNLEYSAMGAETEIQRLNDKCKSYQNEVTRLSQIHGEETTKLKKRIKTLETGIKRLDVLNEYCFTFIKELHKQCVDGIESLPYDRDMDFFTPNVPKSIDDLKNWLNDPVIKEFNKQRKIFTKTEGMIDSLKKYSIDDLQLAYDKTKSFLNRK